MDLFYLRKDVDLGLVTGSPSEAWINVYSSLSNGTQARETMPFSSIFLEEKQTVPVEGQQTRNGRQGW